MKDKSKFRKFILIIILVSIFNFTLIGQNNNCYKNQTYYLIYIDKSATVYTQAMEQELKNIIKKFNLNSFTIVCKTDYGYNIIDETKDINNDFWNFIKYETSTSNKNFCDTILYYWDYVNDLVCVEETLARHIKYNQVELIYFATNKINKGFFQEYIYKPLIIKGINEIEDINKLTIKIYCSNSEKCRREYSEMKEEINNIFKNQIIIF